MNIFKNYLIVFLVNMLCSFVACYSMDIAKTTLSESPGITSLHRAAFEGLEYAVEMLLKIKANPNARNCFGRTPLHDAIHSGSLYIVDLLLAYGANENIVDNEGMTPLFLAVRTNNTPVIALLLQKGAQVNYRVHSFTPLHQAAYNGHLEGIRLLLKHGADINARNMFGRTPMHDIFAGESFSETKVQALLDAHPDLSIQDCDQETPLFIATKKGDHAATCIELLLAKGANPNTYAIGLTPLHIAAFHGYRDIAFILCRYQAHINAQNFLGKTPFIDALDRYYDNPDGNMNAYKQILELLAQYGANPCIQDLQGRTAWSVDHEGGLRRGQAGAIYHEKDYLLQLFGK